MKPAFVAAAIAFLAGPAAAETFVPVYDQNTFTQLVQGKELRNRLYGVRLNVLENGQIAGSAIGWEIEGTWAWQDGYFCRELSWGGDPIPYNCQLVEVRDGDELRFTVDRGAGDSASFRLQ